MQDYLIYVQITINMEGDVWGGAMMPRLVRVKVRAEAGAIATAIVMVY